MKKLVGLIVQAGAKPIKLSVKSIRSEDVQDDDIDTDEHYPEHDGIDQDDESEDELVDIDVDHVSSRFG